MQAPKSKCGNVNFRALAPEYGSNSHCYGWKEAGSIILFHLADCDHAVYLPSGIVDFVMISHVATYPKER